jgi:hypothetical protein
MGCVASIVIGSHISFVNNLFDPKTSTLEVSWNDVFRSDEVVDLIIDNRSKITSPLIAAKIGLFFMKFAETQEAARRVSTSGVYDVIINHCAPHSTTDESAKYLQSETSPSNNPAGQGRFSTPQAVSAIITTIKKYASSPEAFLHLGLAISNLTLNHPAGQQIFATLASQKSFQHFPFFFFFFFSVKWNKKFNVHKI